VGRRCDLVSGSGTDGAAAWRIAGLVPYLPPGPHRWLSIAATARIGRDCCVPVTLLARTGAPGGRAAGAGWFWQAGWGCCRRFVVPLMAGPATGGHSGDSYGACLSWTGQPALLLMALVISAGLADLRAG